MDNSRTPVDKRIYTSLIYLVAVSKAVPQHIYEGAGGRGGIAPTHSRSQH
jgi:hypothetical protein